MSKEKLLKILGSFRVTLPKEWREQHEIPYKGDIEFTEEDGTLRILPTSSDDDDKNMNVLELWRVKLPDEWRSRNNLVIGDFVKGVWADGALIIVPVDVTVKEKVTL